MYISKQGNNKNLLLHYKKINMKDNYFKATHTNSWEITEIVRIFLILGWNIELVDRTVNNWAPTRRYDLFISNSSGSGAFKFMRMAQKIPNTFKVMYAAGPAIDISNQLTNQRYQDLKTRKNLVGPTYSLRVFDENIDDVMLYTNSIICIDDNGFSSQTYDRFHKQTYKLNPSTSPFAFDSSQTILTKKRNSFMYF